MPPGLRPVTIPDVPTDGYWSPSEPSRHDTLLARLENLRQWIAEMRGTPVSKEDDAAAQQAAQQREHEKAQELFEALKRDVEQNKPK